MPGIILRNRNLGKAARQFGRCLNMIGERFCAGGENRVTLKLRSAAPTAFAPRPQFSLEIVAKRCCQGPLIAGPGTHLIKCPVRARARFHGLDERLCFALERSERGASGGAGAFGGLTAGGRIAPRSLGEFDRRCGRQCLAFGAHALGLSGVALRDIGRIIAKRRQVLLDPRTVAFRALQPRCRRHQGRFGHSCFCLFACLCRQRLREFDFGIAHSRFGARNLSGKVGAPGFGLGNLHLERLCFR